MKLKLVDISRGKKCPRQERLRGGEQEYSLTAVFADTPIVDLTAYRRLLTASDSSRLTKIRF